MMYGFGDYMGWGAWLGMAIGLALLVAAIVVLVWLAVGRGGDRRSSARHILDERFAAGEISAEEYQARRRLVA